MHSSSVIKSYVAAEFFKNYKSYGFWFVEQGVVTLIGPVEPFATGIKMKSSD